MQYLQEKEEMESVVEGVLAKLCRTRSRSEVLSDGSSFFAERTR
jgi:hypothetical protein